MNHWFSEQEDGVIEYRYAYDKCLYNSRSQYQNIEVINSVAYGKMLILDGFIMLTEHDEFVYHEMISHIPLCLHPNPKKVLVVGGGDGGTARELLRHQSIEKLVVCELDSLVVDVCREFFPSTASVFSHEKLELVIADGIKHVSSLSEWADVIVVDSTDPVGPGESLFSSDFYQGASLALKPGGIMVAQSESPWANSNLLKGIHSNIKAGFRYSKPYVACVPTYPRGMWSWTIASNSPIDLESFNEDRLRCIESELKYLDLALAVSAFKLPRFFRDKLN